MLGKGSNRLKASTVIVILGAIIPYFLKTSHFGLIMHLDEYFMGVLLRYCYEFQILTKKNSKKISCFAIILSFLLIAFSELNLGNPYLDSILLLFYSSLLNLLLYSKIKIHQYFLNIGRNCYFIYLFHMPFLYLSYVLLNEYYKSNILILFFSFLACFYASCISNRIIERRVLRNNELKN